jgi:hypothetical protein
MIVWPQYLILAIFSLLILVAIINHGKPMVDPMIKAGPIIWITATLLAILGAGGFWKPLGW